MTDSAPICHILNATDASPSQPKPNQYRIFIYFTGRYPDSAICKIKRKKYGYNIMKYKIEFDIQYVSGKIMLFW